MEELEALEDIEKTKSPAPAKAAPDHGTMAAAQVSKLIAINVEKGSFQWSSYVQEHKEKGEN